MRFKSQVARPMFFQLIPLLLRNSNKKQVQLKLNLFFCF